MIDTRHVGPGEGGRLFRPTGFDEHFLRAAERSLRLSALTTRVALPPTLELPTDRPTIVAANHSSLFDLASSLITVAHFGATARMGVAARFFDRPLMGSFLNRIGCIPFSRDRGSEAESTMISSLEQGQMCCLMPEGRVVKAPDRVDGLVGQGRPGISRIARATGAAILPVGFSGADVAWKPGRPVPRIRNRRPVVVRTGRPFQFDGDDHEANADRVMAEIAALVRPAVERPG
ncbi:MAG: lysophospholipid acyltransferase family protein [Actinomycetota bacterium]